VACYERVGATLAIALELDPVIEQPRSALNRSIGC
jgi:hypothetical protein